MPGAAVYIENGGTVFSHGAIASEGDLRIAGDLVVRSGGLVRAANDQFDGGGAVLRVDGALDLSAANDILFADGTSSGLSGVVIEYGNRMGEFDRLILSGDPDRFRLVYTSPPNSGPGQVLLIIPEPSTFSYLCIALAALRRRAHN